MDETPIPKKSRRQKTAGESSANALSTADIKELFVLMRENEIAELELEQQETKIHIVSKGAHLPSPGHVLPMVPGLQQMGMVGVPAAAAPVGQIAPPPAAVAQPASPVGDESSASEGDFAPANVKTVFSPMVGTFYSAPAPDAPPFVQLGETVHEETVLCIIEAMKLMNEIKAEMKGRIYKVLLESGNPVEYNQPLFLIEP